VCYGYISYVSDRLTVIPALLRSFIYFDCHAVSDQLEDATPDAQPDGLTTTPDPSTSVPDVCFPKQCSIHAWVKLCRGLALRATYQWCLKLRAWFKPGWLQHKTCLENNSADELVMDLVFMSLGSSLMGLQMIYQSVYAAGANSFAVLATLGFLRRCLRRGCASPLRSACWVYADSLKPLQCGQDLLAKVFTAG
jgi:hypothetical protein